MRVVDDENIPRRSVTWLRSQGHEVADVRGTVDAGESDDVLWRRAQDLKALLITTDKGFARRRGAPHFGALIVRLRQPNRARILDRIVQALALVAESEWPGLIVIVRDRSFSSRRVRGSRE